MNTVPSRPRWFHWFAQHGSLRTQLIAWNIVILALLLGGLGAVIRGTVYSTMMVSIDRDLEERLRHFHEPPPRPHPPRPASAPNLQASSSKEPVAGEPPRPQPEAELEGENGPPAPPEEPGFAPPQNANTPQNNDPYRPLPLDLQGQALGRQETRLLWDAGAFARAAEGETIHSTVVVNGEPLRILSRPFPPQGEISGVIQTAYPLSETYRALHGLDRALLMLLPVALACAGLAGAYLTGRVLRRIRLMAQAAEQIEAQELSQRLPVIGNDEFAGLAGSFNGLLNRLESAFKRQETLLEQQRRFTADASHELKTPLTIIKGNTSLALSGALDREDTGKSPYRQSMQEIDRAADSMSHLVQDLLFLARSDGGQLGRQPIKLLLREVLERAIAHVGTQASARVTLHIKAKPGTTRTPALNQSVNAQAHELEEALCVNGNERELIRLFANLLANAIRYSPDESRVHATAWQEGGWTIVTVVDTGAGIAPEHLPHLGERFYRVDASRTRPSGGTGLGLSICKGIVEAHGGTLRFASAVGQGTTVTVKLPAA